MHLSLKLYNETIQRQARDFIYGGRLTRRGVEDEIREMGKDLRCKATLQQKSLQVKANKK